MRVAKAITLTNEERVTLTKWARADAVRPAAGATGEQHHSHAAARVARTRTSQGIGCTARSAPGGIAVSPASLPGIEHDTPPAARTPTQRNSRFEVIRKVYETPSVPAVYISKNAGQALGCDDAWCSASGMNNAYSRIAWKGWSPASPASETGGHCGISIRRNTRWSFVRRRVRFRPDRTQKSLPVSGRLKQTERDHEAAAPPSGGGKLGISDCLRSTGIGVDQVLEEDRRRDAAGLDR